MGAVFGDGYTFLIITSVWFIHDNILENGLKHPIEHKTKIMNFLKSLAPGPLKVHRSKIIIAIMLEGSEVYTHAADFNGIL